MTRRTRPPFRAEHIGSLLRPRPLREARARWLEGKLPLDELRAVEDQCIRDAVAMQERAGLQVVTDGEMRRTQWLEGFYKAVDGFGNDKTLPGSFRFHMDDGSVAPAIMHAPITSKLRKHGTLTTDQFAKLAPLTRRTAKATLPAPGILHMQAGDQIFAPAYADVEAFMSDVVAIYQQELVELSRNGCSYVQLDEVTFAVLCDPSNQAALKKRGESAERNIGVYIKAINDIIAARPAGMTIVVHSCRGNRGHGIASGGYEAVAERMFNEVQADGFLLEYDTPRAGDFTPLRYVPKGKMVALGLVSTKRPEVESVEDLRRRLDEAARYIDMEQLALCPQCGFASTFTTERMTEDEQERKLARIVEVADKVWGGA